MNKRLIAFGILTLLVVSVFVSGVAAQETGLSRILSNFIAWIEPLITGRAVDDLSIISEEPSLNIQDTVSACGSLSTPSTAYLLTQDVSSAGTCFDFLADEITLDCQGFAITYAQSTNGHGVNISGFNSAIVRNCTIIQGSSDTFESYGISLSSSNGDNLEYNNISTTNGEITTTDNLTLSNFGISLSGSSQNNISRNNLGTNSSFAVGIFMASGSNNNLASYNVIGTNGSGAFGIGVAFSSIGNVLTENNISTSGFDATGITVAISSPSNQLISNSVFTNGESNALSTDSGSTVFLNNFVSAQNGQGIHIGSDSPSEPSSNSTVAANTIIAGGSPSSGIKLDYSIGTNVSTNNITTSGANSRGIEIGSVSNETFVFGNIILTSGSQSSGILLYDNSSNNTLAANHIRTLSSDASAITVQSGSNNNTLFSNILEPAIGADGITLSIIDGNSLVYNNRINSSNPISVSSAGYNSLNTSLQAGTNIAGGSFIGGNFYVNASGTGYSETCTDLDVNFICDSPLSFNVNNVDYLPLAEVQVPNICGDLASENTVYNLTQNLNSNGTCFNILANNVTLDCQGFDIVGSGTNFGVNNSGGYDYTTIKNCNFSNFDRGINFENPSRFGLIINNTATSNANYGIRINSGSNFTVADNWAYSNGVIGIYFTSSYNNTIRNNTIQSNSYGLYFNGDSSKNIIHSNRIISQTSNGIWLETGPLNNLFYNNFFNNSANIGNDSPGPNSWNISKTSGTNIVSGPNFGGNFWADTSGTGFSETCTDSDSDGICDSSFALPTGDTDRLPLAEAPGAIQCGNLSQENTTYTLTQNVNSSGACFIISANNVTLDCNSFSITGNNSNFGVDNTGGYDYTTVKNCNISNFNKGISFDGGADNGLIINNTANLNINGIFISSSFNNLVANNTANSNADSGITIQASSENNTVIFNTANLNDFYGFFIETSLNNNISHNNASRNTDTGMLVTESSYNIIFRNFADFNGFAGITLQTSSENNTLLHNTANFNTNYGIHLDGGQNNTLFNNTANSNAQYGLLLDSGVSSSILYNNTMNNNTQSGAFLNTVSGNSLISNFFNQNGDHGLSLDAATWNNFSANIINAINLEAVYITSNSENNTFIYNNASSDVDAGLYISASHRNLFYSNYLLGGSTDAGLILETGSSRNSFTHNIVTSLGGDGLDVSNSCNNNNFTANNFSSTPTSAAYIIYNEGNLFEYNVFNSTDGNALYLLTTNFTNVSRNTIFSSTNTALVLDASYNNSFSKNAISSETGASFSSVSSSAGNLIYDNLFNASTIASFTSSGNNSWNTTLQAGNNIINGSFLGGNFYANSSGTGFSETCADGNSDGICDSSNSLATNNIDYLPLAEAQDVLQCGTIFSAGNYNLSSNLSSQATCFIINTSNVDLDCRYYEIRGGSSTTGISIRSSAQRVTIRNCIITNWSRGVQNFDGSHSLTLINNTFISNTDGAYIGPSTKNSVARNNVFERNTRGVQLGGGAFGVGNNNITNNTFRDNSVAVFSSSSDSSGDLIENNTITSNVSGSTGISMTSGLAGGGSTTFRIISNRISTPTGISLCDSCSGNNLFNNIINASTPATISVSPSNNWNRTRQAGTNIFGGPFLGGNFWTNSSNTGFSNTCADSDSDGICDLSLTLATNNIDFLPLSSTSFLSACGTISAPGTYALTQNVISSGACFIISANNVTLDCVGYTINYSQSSTGHAITASSVSRTTIKNCNIVQGSTSASSYGLSLTSVTNLTLINNSILTRGSGSRGVLDSSGGSNHYIGNNITTLSTIGLGIQTSSASNDLIANNTLFALNSVPVALNFGRNNIVQFNDLRTGHSFSTVLDNSGSHNANITDNNITGAGDRAIYLRGSAENNTITRNIFKDSRFMHIEASIRKNLIYNNLINLSSSTLLTTFSYSTFPQRWNTTRSSATNFMGGIFIGGNYWTNTSGTGFSDVCADENFDGICDNSLALNSTLNEIDYLPLSSLKFITSCGDIIENGRYALLNALSSNGTCINVRANDVTLYCQHFSINYSLNTAGHGINVTGYNMTQIVNCDIKQGNSSSSISSAYAINLMNSNGGKISGTNLSTASFASASIVLTGSSGYNISRNNITNTADSAWAILLQSGSNGTLIENNNIYSRGSAGGSGFASTGVRMHAGSMNNTLVGNSIYVRNSNGGTSGAVHLTSSSNNNTVAHNYLERGSGGPTDDAVILVVSSHGNNITANNISHVSSLMAGIKLDSSNNNIVDYNNISTNFGSSSHGIYVYASGSNKVEKNDVLTQGSSSAAVLISTSATLNKVFSNNLRAIGSSAPALQISTSSQNNVAENNSLFGDTGISLLISGTANSNNATGNNISSSSNNGVRIISSSSNILRNNNISSSSGEGLRLLTASASNRFIGGWITSSTAPAISFEDSSTSSNVLDSVLISGGTSYLSTDSSASSNTLSNVTFFKSLNEVRFPGSLTVPVSTSVLITKLVLAHNSTRLDSGALSFLNTSAEITLKQINFTNPQVIRDRADSGNFSVCPTTICSEVSYNSSSLVFIFNVTHFTTYASHEADITPPLITIHSPANATYGNLTIMVNLTVTDDFELDQVWFFNGTGNETYVSPVRRNYAHGANEFRAYANDTSSNLNDTEFFFFFTDVAEPTIIILSPENNSGSSSGNITFAYNVTDANNIDNCTLTLNGVANTTLFNVSKGVAVNFTLFSLSPGNYDWNISCSDSLSNVGKSQARIFSVVSSSEFSGDSTDLSQVNISNVSHFVLHSPSFGKITFISNVDLSNSTDFDSFVNISFNRVEIDSSGMPSLNVSAQIELYNLTFANPQLLLNGQPCPSTQCLKLNYSGGLLVFNVTHFTIYSARETPVVAPSEPESSGGGDKCGILYSCGEWSACQPDGTQTRDCGDRICAGFGKYSETQSCTYLPAPAPAPVIEPSAPEVEKTKYQRALDQVKVIASSPNYIAIALISVFTLALIIRAIVKSRKPGHIYHHTKHFKNTHHYK